MYDSHALSPRSRGAVGVGDVAAERGARTAFVDAINAACFDALRDRLRDQVTRLTAISDASLGYEGGESSASAISSTGWTRPLCVRFELRRHLSTAGDSSAVHHVACPLRSTHRTPVGDRLLVPRQQTLRAPPATTGAGGPRSRGAVGVGDVAGERGARARGYEAWNRGDMDAILAIFHPDVELVTTGVFPGLDPAYRGHDGFRKFWRDFRGTWESLSIAVHELRDCGERVVILFSFRARGRDGLEVRSPKRRRFHHPSGLVVRQENHRDWSTALEAVGLSE